MEEMEGYACSGKDIPVEYATVCAWDTVWSDVAEGEGTNAYGSRLKYGNMDLRRVIP